MAGKDRGDSGGNQGALGSVPMNLENNLKVIDAKISVKVIQKCALLS